MTLAPSVPTLSVGYADTSPIKGEEKQRDPGTTLDLPLDVFLIYRYFSIYG
jgi:hypothetical protein